MGLSAQNTIKMKREVRRIHWYTAEKEKTNDTKVINNTISLGFQRQSHKSLEYCCLVLNTLDIRMSDLLTIIQFPRGPTRPHEAYEMSKSHDFEPDFC